MIITLPPRMASTLIAEAGRRGIAPEELAVEVLRRHLCPVTLPIPADEWERQLFGAAIDCGVSVSDAALSSDGLYD